MDTKTILGLTSAVELIKQSFSRVFDGVNAAAEIGLQSWKLRSVSRDRFAEHVIRTVGYFPLFGTTKQASVESSYVRISLSPDLERDRYRSRDHIAAGMREQRRSEPVSGKRPPAGLTLSEAIERTDLGIALVGLPGSGKTTALRHLALDLAKGQSARQRRVLPIYLAVREMAVHGRGIIEAAQEFLSWLDVPQTKQVLENLLHSGDVALLVDGLDEVDRTYQIRLLDELGRLRTNFMNALVCVSARPHSLELGLSGFAKYETLPLALPERRELVKKWFSEVDPAKGQQLLTYCAQDPNLLELGSSPLMLSIVCALYYNDLKIPNEPDELYARVVEGLLGAWDAFRNIARHTILKDYSVRRRIMITSAIAAATFDQGKLVFTSADVDQLGVLRRFAESTRDSEIDATTLLGSLYNDFGILVERAPGLFSFSHLTLQEYLTAQYVVDNRRELELTRRVSEEEWREVIRLVAKMLPTADDFLARITESVDVAKRPEAELLALVWKTKPICEPARVRKIMTALASRTVAVLKNIRATYGREGQGLIVNVHGLGDDAFNGSYSKAERQRRRELVEAKRHRAQRPIEAHRNLPYIVAALRSCSADLTEYGLGKVQPFDAIKLMSDFTYVRINQV